MKLSGIAAMLTASLAFAGPAAAQDVTATIEGTVRSDMGTVLMGATVTVRNQTTGVRRATLTGVDGRYAILSLPVDGPYDVNVELPGFAPAAQAGVALRPAERATIDFVVSVAASETLVVTGRVVLLDREQASVRQTVNDHLIHSLPLLGRDFIQLTSLAAGFTGNPDFPSPQGQVYWSNNILVDGASHFSKWRSAARAFYSGYGLESIREVQVFTSLFSAEFGEALATVTSAITNSGTNEFRGSGLLFVQDGALNAMPTFATTKPAAGSQQYGFTLGGPLVKDRTHFWGSYEGRRSRGRNIVVSPATPGILVPDNQDEHLLFFRVDQLRSPQARLMVRYNGQWFRWHDEIGGLALPGTGTGYTNTAHTLLVNDAWQVSNRVLNEWRFQVARYVDVRRDLQPKVFVSRAGYSQEGGTLGPFGFGADPEDTWEAADTLTRWDATHAIKVGGGVKHVRAHNTFLQYGRGAYFFAGPPDSFPQPFLYIQSVARREEDAVADPRSISAFGFFQDTWNVRSTLTLNLGMRYDVEKISNVQGYAVPVDQNNFQPRVGVAWNPMGSERMVMRGGVGLYTQQHLFYPINRIELEGIDGAATISLPAGSPLLPAFPATLPLFSIGSVLPARDIYRADAHLSNPYSIQAMLGVERTFFGTVIAADYVWLTGRDLLSLVDANAPASNPKPAQRTVVDADATRPITPLPGTYRKIVVLGNLGRSWYRALQVKAERSMGRLQAVTSYTLSRAEDMANYQLPEDSRNILAEKARADTDIRHNATVGFTFELPGTGRLLRSWSISGLGVFQSNRPYTVTWGDDRNGTTQNDARPGGRNTGRTDAFENINLALAKRVFRGAVVTEARLEVFNVLNTVNYHRYAGDLSSPLFARPVSAFPARRLQLSATVRF